MVWRSRFWLFWLFWLVCARGTDRECLLTAGAPWLGCDAAVCTLAPFAERREVRARVLETARAASLLAPEADGRARLEAAAAGAPPVPAPSRLEPCAVNDGLESTLVVDLSAVTAPGVVALSAVPAPGGVARSAAAGAPGALACVELVAASRYAERGRGTFLVEASRGARSEDARAWIAARKCASSSATSAASSSSVIGSVRYTRAPSAPK